MLPGHSPAPDAALFPFGKQRWRQTKRGAIAAALLGLAMPLPGFIYGKYGIAMWIFSVLWFLVLGATAVFMAWSGWADRHMYLAFDATGVWWRHNEKGHVVIPWASLEAAGLFWCHQEPNNTGHRLLSLELCPIEGVKKHDRALSPLIVQDRSGLPGVADRRYRIGIPVFASRHYGTLLVEVARSRAAHLWFGEHERPSGYIQVADLIS
ncbi:hypothetical protein FCH28_09280 [Streptomyces piniterrae]|uniref:Uncharacterized protein n=1 Tax=Streptomyces piniterrae TaxID=2571125 RepID=A0A4U0NNU4_9ACTN|nr:hypothetical protein [Streptomyces piniterrae]TJZ55532.1 hypothetical protein FCH28_09280 [Streptomyces piniterrae]